MEMAFEPPQLSVLSPVHFMLQLPSTPAFGAARESS